jgi:pimaricinolide synthase PimS2/candicidin polyketide synthase FscD
MLTEDELRRYLRRAVGDARAATARADELTARAREPIAIVGTSCRFAGGVASAADLWELVAAGGDGIGALPGDRGWDTTGIAVRAGGFLADVAGFDAGFFGISPREALTMDPQQRLLLELVWEGFEHAAIDVTALRGGRVGTFVGTTGQDYVELLPHAADRGHDFLATSNAASVLSGRVAYLFGFEGPALTVDTACSSSLVALHLAVRSLRADECDLALACGATVLSTPLSLRVFGRQGALAEDGRCKAFSAAADGMGVGEGAGVVLLERLSVARRLGHPVLAVVRGSAVNQDGASNGLSAPNGRAQQRVIRAALADAGLTVSDVDLMEAHGTGTVLGDPIEAGALLATYGQRTGEPLLVGSVKSNIGHTQAAAGIAGVVKAVGALRHGQAPPTLHVGARNPHVDWDTGAVAVLTEGRALPVLDRPHRAAVSSFGISGTNAHVILEQVPEPAAGTGPGQGPFVWPVSAKGKTALHGQTTRLRTWLAGSGATPGQVAAALAARAPLPDRVVVWGREPAALLDALHGTGTGAGIVHGTARDGTGLGWLFSGQGGQRTGMGTALADRFPAFREALDELTDLAGPAGPVARELLSASDDELAHTATTQTATFVLQVALARLWQSWGVRPDVLIGHSVGELAAAHVAGAFPLDVAWRLVRERARVMGNLPAGGAMLAIGAGADEVTGLLTAAVAVAAVNGPAATVVSGPEDAVVAVAAAARARGLRVRRLRTSHAFHSPAMAAARDEFRSVAADVLAGVAVPPPVPVVSTRTGRPLTPRELVDPGHWADQLREPVRFADAVRTALAQGTSRFLELGPDGTLVAAAQECGAARAVATLRADRSDVDAVTEAAARLFVSGVDVDWAALNQPARPLVPLPPYAFQHTRYWLDPAATAGSARERDFWDRARAGDASGLAAALGVAEADLAPVLPALARWADGRAPGSGARYRVDWVPLPSTGGPPAPAGTWLLLTDDRASEPAAALARHGERVLVLEVTGDLHAVEAALRSVTDPVRGILVSARSRSVHLAVAQAAAAACATRVWVLTRGAVGVVPGDPPPDPHAAWAWGFWASVAKEHPALWGGLIDLGADLDGDVLAQALACAGDGPVAIRADGVFARRLRREPPARPADPWRPAGTVVVTGGTGYVGGHLARWAARRGAPHVLLLGLDGPGDGTAALVGELRSLGARATVRACDVTDRADLAAALAGIGADCPLDAVVHAAGSLDEALVADLTADRVERAFATKVSAVEHLLDLTSGADLSTFVVCSSFPGLVGSPGRAAYSGANAALDAVTAHRPVTCVVWGRWDGPGTAPDRRARDAGAIEMTPARATAELSALVDSGTAHGVVADVDWDVHAAHAGRVDPLFTDLVPRRPAPVRAPVPAGPRAVLDEVRAAVAEVLGAGSGAAVGPDDPFLDIGLTSLTATELRNRVADTFAVPIPVSVVFDAGSATELARWVTRHTASPANPSPANH